MAAFPIRYIGMNNFVYNYFDLLVCDLVCDIRAHLGRANSLDPALRQPDHCLGQLAHGGRNKMAAVLQTAFSNPSFSWVNIVLL